MSKHTPGPWTVGIYEVTPTMLERMKFKQWAVCCDDNAGDPKGLLVAMCGDINPEDKDNSAQSFADAKLIAAAPDLLEALEWALDCDVLPRGPLFDKAVFAIMAAKGLLEDEKK